MFENISGKNDVSFTDLFNKSFMTKFSKFSSFEELLEASNFVVNSPEDFKAIPKDKFNSHVKAFTKFSTWEEMYSKAGELWTSSQLFK